LVLLRQVRCAKVFMLDPVDSSAAALVTLAHPQGIKVITAAEIRGLSDYDHPDWAAHKPLAAPGFCMARSGGERRNFTESASLCLHTYAKTFNFMNVG
jgi:hypothetical protein